MNIQDSLDKVNPHCLYLKSPVHLHRLASWGGRGAAAEAGSGAGGGFVLLLYFSLFKSSQSPEDKELLPLDLLLLISRMLSPDILDFCFFT